MSMHDFSPVIVMVFSLMMGMLGMDKRVLARKAIITTGIR